MSWLHPEEASDLSIPWGGDALRKIGETILATIRQRGHVTLTPIGAGVVIRIRGFGGPIAQTTVLRAELDADPASLVRATLVLAREALTTDRARFTATEESRAVSATLSEAETLTPRLLDDCLRRIADERG